MKPIECEFEGDALAAALQSRWPDHVDAQLRAHVADCPTCADVVTVASAVEDAREEMRARTLIPDSGLVWWRAQLRARREAAETAGRPITAAQLVAFACAVGLLGACFGATSTWFQSAFRSIASSLGGFDAKAFLHLASTLLAEHGALVLAMAVMLFLVPTAVYLVVGRD
jgi:predicted anti-sigma-YlaC factor YlaD